MLSKSLRRWHKITSTLNQRRVFTQLDIEKINVDITTFIIKPIHARWLIAVIEEITQKTYCIIKGLLQAGLK